MDILEKSGCVRCGKPSKNGGKGGRCSACLKKLASNKKKPGHWQRAQTKADDALRRQDGKNGTASKKSSGRGNRKDIVKQHQSAEKRTGQKLSPDRKDNGKGYAKGNTRSIPEKLNRGRHTANPKKLAAWRKNLKKHDLTALEMATLLRAKAWESGDAAIIEAMEKSIGKKIAGAALAGSMAMGAATPAKADVNHLKGYLSNIHGMEIDGHKVSVKHSGKEGEKGSGVGKFTISVGDFSMNGSYSRAGDEHNDLKLSPMTHNKEGHKPFEGEMGSSVDEKGTAAADALQEHLGQDGGKTSLWGKLTKPTLKKAWLKRGDEDKASMLNEDGSDRTPAYPLSAGKDPSQKKKKKKPKTVNIDPKVLPDKLKDKLLSKGNTNMSNTKLEELEATLRKAREDLEKAIDVKAIAKKNKEKAERIKRERAESNKNILEEKGVWRSPDGSTGKIKPIKGEKDQTAEEPKKVDRKHLSVVKADLVKALEDNGQRTSAMLLKNWDEMDAAAEEMAKAISSKTVKAAAKGAIKGGMAAAKFAKDPRAIAAGAGVGGAVAGYKQHKSEKKDMEKGDQKDWKESDDTMRNAFKDGPQPTTEHPKDAKISARKKKDAEMDSKRRKTPSIKEISESAASSQPSTGMKKEPFKKGALVGNPSDPSGGDDAFAMSEIEMASPDKPEEGRNEVCGKCGHEHCDCKYMKKSASEQLDEIIETLMKSKDAHAKMKKDLESHPGVKSADVGHDDDGGTYVSVHHTDKAEDHTDAVISKYGSVDMDDHMDSGEDHNGESLTHYQANVTLHPQHQSSVKKEEELSKPGNGAAQKIMGGMFGSSSGSSDSGSSSSGGGIMDSIKGAFGSPMDRARAKGLGTGGD